MTGTNYDCYGNKQGNNDVNNVIEGDNDDNITSFVCEPNDVLGNNPRDDGSRHAPVPNTFFSNAIEAENDQVPATLSGLSMYLC
jgi:hypothetical protein